MQVITFVCLLIAIAAPAHADPRTRSVAARIANPEVAARRLRAAADEHFVAGRFEAALAGYQRALAYWNHPKLQFSIGLCQLELRDWVAAAIAFEAALEIAGLGGREIAEARDYLASVRSKTAVLEIVDRYGGTISVDGKPFAGHALRVMPGPHVVVARRGDVSATETVRLGAGETRRVTPVLQSLHVRTRWARWVPWTVTGTGVAVAASALPLLSLQRDRIADANRLAEGCIGCDRGDQYDALVARAGTYRRYAAIAGGVGGAIALTGLVLIAANRPLQEKRALPVVSATGDGLAVGLTGAW